MVEKRYMLEKPSPPSASTLFINQRVVPWAIDAAADVENALMRTAIITRRAPFMAIVMALGLGWLAGLSLARRHTPI